MIIQIVPQLPPAIDGVGDQALNLARQLKTDFDIQTQFVVGDPCWAGDTKIAGFPIHTVNRRSASALNTLLHQLGSSQVPILLHYVGYGYNTKGCPIWLIQGLQQWRHGSGAALLLTMFHEVYASGPPWTSAFWSVPLQRYLVKGLIQLSDRSFTSKQYYAQVLGQLHPVQAAAITVLPVFSNVGEPAEILPLAQRTRRLVVFGNRHSRQLVYQQLLEALTQTCASLDVKEIYDIGAPTGLALVDIQGIPVVEMGVTAAPEVSQILQDAIAGFLSAPPPDYLAKSSVFAAFCAHGVTPLMVTTSSVTIDGLTPGTHYWTPETSEPLSLGSAQAIADNAHTWYQSHSLPVQARIFAKYLQPNPEPMELK